MIDKPVLMLGGTGFVGRSMLRWTPSMITIHAVGSSGYESTLKSYECGYIVHLAPIAAPIEPLIECARRNNAVVLYASSGAVFDNPGTEYGLTKLKQEEQLLSSGLDVRIARLYTFAGPHLDGSMMLPTFIRRAREKRTLQLHGHVVRSYMYASDMAEWMWAILDRGRSGVIYTVGSERPVNSLDLAKEVRKHFNPPPDLELVDGPPSPRPVYLPVTTLWTRSELGVTLKVDFEDAIKRTVEEY